MKSRPLLTHLKYLLRLIEIARYFICIDPVGQAFLTGIPLCSQQDNHSYLAPDRCCYLALVTHGSCHSLCHQGASSITASPTSPIDNSNCWPAHQCTPQHPLGPPEGLDQLTVSLQLLKSYTQFNMPHSLSLLISAFAFFHGCSDISILFAVGHDFFQGLYWWHI